MVENGQYKNSPESYPRAMYGPGVMDEKQKGWLFMTARPDQREALRPLISAWMDIAINALMVLPENKRRRLWFVMDELAALQRLPHLQTGLAESRKYGGCFW